MYLMSLPLSVLMGWDIRTIILITGISVTLYAFRRRVLAVTYNNADLVHRADCRGGDLPDRVAGHAAGAGPPADRRRESQVQPRQLRPVRGRATFWVVLVYGIVMNLQNFGIDQNYIQRDIAFVSTARPWRASGSVACCMCPSRPCSSSSAPACSATRTGSQRRRECEVPWLRVSRHD